VSARQLHEHAGYVHDVVRVAALERAVAAVVRPGHVVVDLGAGTGIVALLACRAGAARVYAVDEGSMLELARQVCAANGVADRVVFVSGLSTRISLPEKVDVAIADQVGPFGFEGGLRAFAKDARARLMKEGGVFVPSRIHFRMAPIECAHEYDEIDRWGTRPAGFDFGAARSWATSTPRNVEIQPEQLLAEPVECATIHVGLGPNALELDATFTIAREGRLHGIAGWFEAELAPGVAMTNSPIARERIRRANKLLPIERATRVGAGDVLRARLRVLQDEPLIGWRVTVRSASGEARADFSASSFGGMLASREDIERLAPTRKPRRSEWADAELEVLGMFDGAHALSAIAEALATSRPGLFRRREDAAVFVAEIVKRHAV
jgi:protein arginine N-methyltransferase 1